MSKRSAFIGADIFDGAARRKGQAVLVEAGRVIAVTPAGELPDDAERIELEGGLLAPGFVDLQVNGGGGALLNEVPTVDGIRAITAAHRKTGTTALLPTLITDLPEVSAAAMTAARAAIEEGVPGCLGLHLEGPHLSVARKGAHDPKLIRPMNAEDLARMAGAGIPNLLLTVAAETVPPQQIAALRAAGIHVSIGHSDASYEMAMTAFSAGAHGVTHLFNAQSQLGHRTPGVVGAALDHPDTWCGLIADGFHVHPAAITTALRAKRAPGRLFLVSDSMSTIGTDMTEFTLNGRKILRGGGKLTLADGTLAGSDITLLDAVRFMVGTIGLPLDETLRMASLYPAQFLRVDDSYGRIAPGARADFVHLTDALDAAAVFLAGEALPG